MMMWGKVLAALALLTIATTADGATAPTFFTNFSQGGLTEWTTSGSPTLESDGTHNWLRIDPADNIAKYAYRAVSGTPTTYTYAQAWQITSFPAQTGSTVSEVELATTLASGLVPQMLIALGSDGRIRLHFKDLGRECSSNGTYPFSTCTLATATTDCPIITGGSPGETACEIASYSQSGILTIGTTVHVAVSASTSGNSITATLYVNGLSQGTKTRWEGVCTAGADTGKACHTTASLPACTTCSGSAIGAITHIRLGTAAAETTDKAFDAQATHVGFTPAIGETEGRWFRVEAIWPGTDNATNQWSNNGCTNHGDCVDDGLANDDDTTNLSESSQDDAERWAMDDPASLASGESWVAARATATLRHTGTTTAVDIGIRDTGATIDAANVSVTSSSYGVYAGPIIPDMPSGGALAPNNLQGWLKLTGVSPPTVRGTNYSIELMVALPAPTVPNVLRDVNGNGRKSIAIAGDSTVDRQGIFSALNAQAEEPDDILRCAKGGRKIGDLRSNWSNILAGLGTGDMPCAAERGQLTKPDYVFLQVGANDLATLLQQTSAGYCMQRGCVGGSTPGIACKVNGDCGGGGTCTDRAGPQHGGGCFIASGTNSDAGTSWVTSRFCGLGSNIQGCCAGVFCTTDCAAGARGCVGGSNANGVCTSDADCSGGDCQPWGMAGSIDTTDDTYGYGACLPGSITAAQCPLGVCMHEVTTAYMGTAMQALWSQAQARTGGDKVILIPIGHYDAIRSGAELPTGISLQNCVAGANHGNACTSDANCTGGVCRFTAGVGVSRNAHERLRWWHNYTNDFAEVHQLPSVAGAYYLNRLNGSELNAHLSDSIHGSDSGVAQLATLLTACLERDTSVRENRCNDLSSETLPAVVLPLDQSYTIGAADVMYAQTLGAPSATRQVDAIANYHAVASGNVKCSVYTLSGFNLTKHNSACDSAATPVTVGWQSIPTTTPASCTLSAGTTYYAACIYDNSTFRLVGASNGPDFIRGGSNYSGAMPAGPVPVLPLVGQALSMYAQVH